MIGRNLARRQQHLESRVMPPDEPVIIQIQYASPDGRVVEGPRITIPVAGGRRAGRAGLAAGKPPALAGRQDREDLPAE